VKSQKHGQKVKILQNWNFHNSKFGEWI